MRIHVAKEHLLSSTISNGMRDGKNRRIGNDMDEWKDVDVQNLSDEELLELSGGANNTKYCPMGTFKMCETIDGVRKCWCEPLYIKNSE